MSTSTQRKRRRQPPEETRRQILDTALAFLGEHSFRELNVDALMARTGHTRTLFYRHFDDIPSLVLALIQDVGGELMVLAQEWSATPGRSPEEAHRRLSAFVDFHTRNRAAVRAVVEASHHNDAIEQAYTQMIEAFVTITATTMQAGIAAGDLDPIDDPQEVARALVRMLNGYLGDPRRSEDPDRALEAVWTVWTRTLHPGHPGRS